MNSRDYLDRDITRINRVLKGLGFGVWSVAAFVMIYGVPVAFGPLKNHGIPGAVAWMPSLAADAAMAVAIIAGPVLSSYMVRAGWIGILRWTAAFTTWALQTAGSWLHPGGPDLAGVGLHSLPPALLFVVGEGAAYFVRKMSDVLETKKRELASAEQKDADRRAHLAEVEANYRAAAAEVAALTSEREGNLREVDNLRAEVASATTRLTAAEGTVGDLQTKLDDTSARLAEESSTANLRTSEVVTLTTRVAELEASEEALRDHYETRLRDDTKAAAEALRKAKLEARLPHLEDRRRDRSGGGVKSPSTRPRNRAEFDDEEAVQRLLEEPSDPVRNLPAGDLREWSQQAIVDTLRVGWPRSKRLVEAVAEEQRRRASEAPSGDRAVNQ